MPYKPPPGVFRRCPECKSLRVEFTEHLTILGTWEQDENGVSEECRFHSRSQTGEVDAWCQDCGHLWSPKGFNGWMLDNRH